MYSLRKERCKRQIFLWVKTHQCGNCARVFDLFPGYLLAENRRHPKNVLVCPSCGELHEEEDRNALGSCSQCQTPLILKGPAARSRCACPDCGTVNVYPRIRRPGQSIACSPSSIIAHAAEPLIRDVFLRRRSQRPLEVWRAEKILRNSKQHYIPDNQIPAGDETDRLHRWGYSRYREMFNKRQLLSLELACRAIGPSRRINASEGR